MSCITAKVDEVGWEDVCGLNTGKEGVHEGGRGVGTDPVPVFLPLDHVCPRSPLIHKAPFPSLTHSIKLYKVVVLLQGKVLRGLLLQGIRLESRGSRKEIIHGTDGGQRACVRSYGRSIAFRPCRRFYASSPPGRAQGIRRGRRW